jgi:ABC-type transporter Mla maintaining outer membrane lipid asymmetry ATPase subunit MlaF
MISAMIPPESGKILFKNQALADLNETQLNRVRGRMGFVTDPPVFLNNLPIMENLRLPLRYHSSSSPSSIEATLKKIFQDLGLSDFPDRIPSHFDLRFLGAAALARALSVSPDLFVFVRPLETLDEILAFRLRPLLKEYVTKRGGAVLVLSTVPRLAVALSDKIAVFKEGGIEALEKPEAYRPSLKNKDTQVKPPGSPGSSDD